MNDKIKNSSSLRETAPTIVSLREELENNIKSLIELARDKVGYSSSLMRAFMSSIEKLHTMPY